MSYYALKKKFQFKVKRSCNRSYVLQCMDENCKWVMKASTVQGSSYYKVKEFNNMHTCNMEERYNGNKHATYLFIGKIMQDNFRNIKRTNKPVDIIEDMNKKFGLKVDYKKAWRANNIAKELVWGKFCDAYRELPNYLYRLKMTNPGSHVQLKTNSGSVVDGAHLKCGYGGTLLTACTQNAAGTILPLAFAVVDSENNDSWKWFFEKFKEACGEREGMSIMSDRHESIRYGASEIYPDAGHYHCIYHLVNNVKSRYKKDPQLVNKIFMKAAKAYTVRQFNHHMKELGKIGNRIVTYLTVAPLKKEQWAAVHGKHNRRTAMTSNNAESLNSANNEAREMPLIAMLELLRTLIQNFSYNNRKIADCTFTRLTTKYESKMQYNYSKGSRMKVNASSFHVYNVINEQRTYAVNIDKKTCTCEKFQADEFPCEHAVAVSIFTYTSPYQYCSYYYTKKSLKEAYATTVQPVSTEQEMQIPEDILKEIVDIPQGKPLPSKTRKRRALAYYETYKVVPQKCGRCSLIGHNQRTCKNIPTRDI